MYNQIYMYTSTYSSWELDNFNYNSMTVRDEWDYQTCEQAIKAASYVMSYAEQASQLIQAKKELKQT